MTKNLLLIALFLLAVTSFAQSVYAPINSDYYYLLDRYEIKNGAFSKTFHATIKSYERKAIAEFVDSFASASDSAKLSKSDQFNLNYLRNDNREWSTKANNDRKPILKYFYDKNSDFYSVHTKDFDFHLNPVAYFQYGKDKETGSTAVGLTTNTNYINTRGIEFRGMVDQRVGFYFFFTDNQAQFPGYVNQYINAHNAIPEQSFYKTFNNNFGGSPTGYDFLTGRGYITFSVTKHIQVQLGRDRNFIGNGYRSLILSDFSGIYNFLKNNTKVWKLNYMNLFAQMNAGGQQGADTYYPQKYFALHHLSYNVSKNFNLGIYEAIVFGPRDTVNGTKSSYDWNYLTPVVPYLAVNQQLGSPDNAFFGFDYRWNFLSHFSLYGQLVIDDMDIKELVKRNGFWGNKQALQTGLKYIDAFGIRNLDFQGELNIIKPYTYSQGSNPVNSISYSNYTNYNLPLADPLGANLKEFIGIARYQPLPRLSLTGKLFYVNFGSDTVNPKNQSVNNVYGANDFGGNILKGYNLVPQYHAFGNKIGQGISNHLVLMNFTITYQVAHNLFIDVSQTLRKLNSSYYVNNSSSNVLSVALRWNIPKRLFEF